MDLFLHHARVLTMLEGSPPADSLLVRAGRIVSVGPAAEVRPEIGREAREVDLGGRTVIPGYTDSHIHFTQLGLSEGRLKLNGAASLEEALALVNLALANQDVPGSLIRGENWDESSWPEGRGLTRQDLDQLSAETPLLLRRVCGHLAVANRAGVELVVSRGGEIDPASGIMLEETSLNLDVLIPPTPDEEDEAVRLACERAASLGVTAVHDMARTSHLAAYLRARQAGRLTVRIVVHQWHPGRDPEAPFPPPLPDPDELLLPGGVKLFVDGSLGARTAALNEPYLDDPRNRGMLLWERPALARMIYRAEDAGLCLLLHAIGDLAVETALDAISEVLGTGRNRLGHRIEHLELISDADMDRMARLGVVASVQPNFAGHWSSMGGAYEARLGKERTERANPFRSLYERGIPMAFGSDGMPFSPALGLASAMSHPNRSERLTLEEALPLYTEAGARIVAGAVEESGGAGWGVLAPGRSADIAVLAVGSPSGAPLEVDLTLAGGKALYVSERFAASWSHGPAG